MLKSAIFGGSGCEDV